MTYDPKIWFQVSSRHRIVARLPEGKTGTEALRESGGQRCDDEAWLRVLGERGCGDHYLRLYARERDDWRELTPEQWRAFKRAGGSTYMDR